MVTPLVDPVKIYEVAAVNLSPEDEEFAKSIVTGSIPSYSLESRLADCRKAAAIRRSTVQMIIGKSLEGLPLKGFDYDSILRQCCEMLIGFVQIPVSFFILIFFLIGVVDGDKDDEIVMLDSVRREEKLVMLDLTEGIRMERMKRRRYSNGREEIQMKSCVMNF